MANMETESDEKRNQCEDCNKAFTTKMDIEAHLCIETGECSFLCKKSLHKKYHCCLCGKKFNLYRRLKDHINSHSGEKPYICPHCHFRSSSSDYMKLHVIKTHTKEFKNNCCFCFKGFLHKPELERHIQRFHQSKETNESIAVTKEKVELEENKKQADQIHWCSFCTYVTNFKTNLVKHLWTHSSQRPYQCEMCNKGYRQKSHLNDHLRTHTGERPFICNTCGKGFSSKNILRTHERYHCKEPMYLRDPTKSKVNSKIKEVKNNKPIIIETNEVEPVYQCTLCPRTFSKANCLVNHFKVHTVEHPFECETCKKVFTTQTYLEKHECPKNDMMHCCPFCPFSVSRKFSLKMHIQTHSSIQKEQCEVSKKVIGSKETNRKTLRRSQILRCSHCAYVTYYKTNFEKHVSTHSSQQPLCSKGYIRRPLIKDHLRTHAVKCPFICNSCGQGFSYQRILQTHERYHCKKIMNLRDLSKSRVKSKINVVKDYRPIVKKPKENTKEVKPEHQCTLCPKTFSKLADLVDHLKVHTVEYPFKCATCKKGFLLRTDLEKHKCSKNVSKKDDVMHRCPFCPFSASLEHSLVMHIQTHSSNYKEQCEVFIEHYKVCNKTQPFTCSTCGRKFFLLSYLKFHESLHSASQKQKL